MGLFALLFGDFFVFFTSLFIALSIRYGGFISLQFYVLHIKPFLLLFVIHILIMYMLGVYGKNFRYTTRNIFNTVLSAVSWLSVTAVLLFYLYSFGGVTPKTNLLIFVIVLFIFTLVWHVQLRHVARLSRAKVILVGGPHCPADFDIVRIIPPESDNKIILSTIANSGIKRVLIDFNNHKIPELLPVLHTLMLSGVSFIDLSKVEEEDSGKINLKTVDERWLLHSLQHRYVRMYRFIKRITDVVVVILFMPICIVLFPLIMVAIKIQNNIADVSHGNIFIQQERLGLNRHIFMLYKFRTMTCDDAGVWHEDVDKMITPIGKFLRKSRIDELPQLWNILKGDMSFTGPRPDIVNLGRTLADKIPYYNARYIVRPGLTGWAQVSQKVVPQSISESKERLAYDLYYIKSLSMFLELKILLKTIKLTVVKMFS